MLLLSMVLGPLFVQDVLLVVLLRIVLGNLTYGLVTFQGCATQSDKFCYPKAALTHKSGSGGAFGDLFDMN